MPNPGTPLKADEGINGIILDLSAKWRLQLPLRDKNWSPAKHANQSVEHQIHSSIRYLYFKDRPALDEAIRQFERQAPSIDTKWPFKPKADADVIPTRTRLAAARREEFLINQVDKEEKAVAELRKCLLEKLQNASREYNKRKEQEESKRTELQAKAALNHIPQQAESPKLPAPRSHDLRPSLKSPEKRKQSTLKGWCTSPAPQSSTHRKNSTKAQHPSSDEYPLYQDEIQAMDVETSGNRYSMAQADSLESTEHGFKTAPTTPSDEVPLPQESKRTVSDDFVFDKPEMIHVKPLASSPTRKRLYEDVTEPSMRRKVSREESTSSIPRSHIANDIQPTTSFLHKVIPNYNDPLRQQKGRDSSSVSTGPQRSFGSDSSLGSLMTGLSTGLTTPNTSFEPPSTSTSFDTSYDQSELTLTVSERHRLQLGASEQKRPNPKHETTSKNSVDEPTEYKDDLNFDPMELDDIAERLGQGQGPESSLPIVEEPDPIAINPTVETYLQANLFQQSPFKDMTPCAATSVPFRQCYEVVRAANACSLPMATFEDCLQSRIDDYEILWSRLTESTKLHGKAMPERSNLRAWKRAETKFEGVALTGSLTYNEKAGAPLLKFGLGPLKLDSSYRLSRQFGGDRFCVLSIPGIDSGDLPQHLKAAHSQVRSTLVKWLVDEEHNFLGRKWRAFFVKPNQNKKSARSNKKLKAGYRIFFFAEDGDDFSHREATGELDPRKTNHAPTTRKSMLDWFIPAEPNAQQTVLKFFARLALAVSSTKATIVFEPREIIRTDDARADNPQPRRISIKRSDEKKTNIRPVQSEAKVMNDGCARISRKAAKDIASRLGTDYVPCVFQGRIAGAKGIWMVDALDESIPNGRGYWIEITDSQLKFEGHNCDQWAPDPKRVTFEVQSFSKKLSAASLNFQLIPILEDRGVPYEVFKRLLEEDLTSRISELGDAMQSPLDIRIWNQENNSVTEERIQNNGIEMVGGLPLSLAEKINWFVEHGFQPSTCRFLKDLLYQTIHDYCMRLENRMNIGLGLSTYAFMIADPLAQLEENEIHIGFSHLFRDTKSGRNETMLHSIDVLVARLPALLPSDVQKVRAVFKPELGVYRDVVVFSSKGQCSLAEKLSGGDYDGDKAWICWDPDIVGPFRNAEVPTAPPLQEYGISRDTVKMCDLLSRPDYMSSFLRHGFDFNLQPSLLGSCTVYHEAMCYEKRSINEEFALSIASLLGLLVDRAKAGIIFDERKWTDFLKKRRLPKNYPKPYYKNKEKARPTNHLIDRLLFEVAKGVREKALGNFTKAFANVGTQDEDLVRRWKEENEDAKDDNVLKSVLSHLKGDLKSIHDYWMKNTRADDGYEDEKKSSKRPDIPSFNSVLEKCRGDFIKVEPLPVEGHPTVTKWRRDQARKRNGWSLLKASAIYNEWNRGKFAWYVAGVELGELKATAGGSGSYTPMVMEIASALKLDSKMARKRQRADDGDLDDEYGSDIDVEDIDDIQ